MIVRKIKNISEADVPVQIDNRTTVFIKPGMEIKNMPVMNLGAIQRFVTVEYDLSEVTPIKEGLQQING
jgi:hypothetical protein